MAPNAYNERCYIYQFACIECIKGAPPSSASSLRLATTCASVLHDSSRKSPKANRGVLLVASAMFAPTVSCCASRHPQLQSAAVKIVPARQMQRILDPSRVQASILLSLCVKRDLNIPHEMNSIHILMLFYCLPQGTAASLERCLQCVSS